MLCKVDYLRLASWDPDAYTKIISEFMAEYPSGIYKWEQGSFLQYSGWKYGSMFIGKGEQRKMRHTIAQSSGYDSHEFYKHMARYPKFYCTRIDLQITIPKPDDVSLPLIHAQLGNKISTLISSELNDTLYVGRRTSDMFIRLYEKNLDDGLYLRLEFELKGGRSKAAWDALTEGETLSAIYAYYVKKCRLPQTIKTYFEQSDDTITDHAMRQEILGSEKRKLEWLRSLDNSVMEALHNHTIGLDVAVLVKSWADMADRLDSQMGID